MSTARMEQELTPPSTIKVALLTAIALACFAGNSLLCRLALAQHHIDATAFTGVRLASGAIVLALLARRSPARPVARGLHGWLSAALLFAYAAPFTFAYLRLGAAIGALVLFAAVQVTMIGWGVARGERPTTLAWLGILVAIGGLVGLTAPGATAPDPLGALGMAVAGAAWGLYSLRGRAVGGDPLRANAVSFARTLPFAALVSAIAFIVGAPHASPLGIELAVASGALASGCGYAVWFAALPHLTATRAAVLQLLVPILATGGAITLLGETLSARFVFASLAILGGVAITLAAQPRRRGPSRSPSAPSSLR